MTFSPELPLLFFTRDDSGQNPREDGKPSVSFYETYITNSSIQEVIPLDSSLAIAKNKTAIILKNRLLQSLWFVSFPQMLVFQCILLIIYICSFYWFGHFACFNNCIMVPKIWHQYRYTVHDLRCKSKAQMKTTSNFVKHIRFI